jgi:hypothetical protein
MKKCRSCLQLLDVNNFRKNKRSADGYATICKICIGQYEKHWYKNNPKRRASIVQNNSKQIERNRITVISYLQTHPCIDCGEADIVVLDFDHQGNKRMEVSCMMHSAYSTETLLLEMDKCKVRCANCHRRKTARENNWLKAGIA